MKQRRLWPLWAYFAIAIIVFLLDYATKKLVEATIVLNEETVSVLGNFFLLTHIHNNGAAFGMLQGGRYFFLAITVIVVAGIAWYLWRAHHTGSRLLLFALGMVLGGAIGNFLDRALYGRVVDFFQFNFGSYTFPIFNVADIAIVCGVALIILDTLLQMKQENSKHDNDEQAPDAPGERQSV